MKPAKFKPNPKPGERGGKKKKKNSVEVHKAFHTAGKATFLLLSPSWLVANERGLADHSQMNILFPSLTSQTAKKECIHL